MDTLEPEEQTSNIETKEEPASEIDSLQADQLTEDEIEDLIDLDPAVYAVMERLSKLRSGSPNPEDTEDSLVNEMQEARKAAREKLFPEKATADLAKEDQRKALVNELAGKIKPDADFDSKLRTLELENFGVRSLPIEILSDKTRNALVEYIKSIIAFNGAFAESSQQNRNVEAMKALDINRRTKHNAASESLSSDVNGVLTMEECRKVIEKFLEYKLSSTPSSKIGAKLDKLIEEYSLELPKKP